MQIMLWDGGSYLGPKKYYVDIVNDEGPTALIIKSGADVAGEIVDEYNLGEKCEELIEKNNEISLEMEYNAFLKWLDDHKNIGKIYVTSELLRYFYFQK